MKKILTGKIIENKPIAKDIHMMVIEAPEVSATAFAGQFINVYMNDKSLILPRPISICKIEGSCLTIVYKTVGKGTIEMSGYRTGDSIKISSAMGNGFRLEYIGEADRIVLVGGGVGVPPLVELAKAIRGQGSKAIIAVIGFQEEPFLVEEVKKYCDQVYIATDNGAAGFHGNVIDLIKEQGINGNYYFSCGPKPMLRALAGYCESEYIPVQVSLEERMGCGYGACVGCTCRTRSTEESEGAIVLKKVCKDGPVFLGSEVVWDE